jgi:hypothetical protein
MYLNLNLPLPIQLNDLAGEAHVAKAEALDPQHERIWDFLETLCEALRNGLQDDGR